MSNEVTVFDLGKLSKPATVLVEKLSSGLGILYEPTRIKRLAKAQSAARMITAQSEEEVRAFRRAAHQEVKKLQNLEAIAFEAVKQLPDHAEPSNIDLDWLTFFGKHAEGISNAQMQSLWAALLSKEATAPGTFSRQTLNITSVLGRADANLFTSLCRVSVDLAGSVPHVITTALGQPKLTGLGITFDSLAHLESLGLITFDPAGNFNVTIGVDDLKKGMFVDYFDERVVFDFVSSVRTLPVGHALLTMAGKELRKICGAEKADDFLPGLMKDWMATVPLKSIEHLKKVG